MKKSHNSALLLLIILVCGAALVLTGCGNGNDNNSNQQPEILEPGLPTELDPQPDLNGDLTDEPDPEIEEPNPDEIFVDKERASTIDDLMANMAKIESYYYEQTLEYTSSTYKMAVWYKDDKMHTINTGDGMQETHFYYDFRGKTIVSYTPEQGNTAILYTFDDDDPSLPQILLQQDYHKCRVIETGEINGQICRVLETPQGDTIWVSTKYGFPLQVEFIDGTNDEHLITPYENVQINQVRDEDVSLPADLVIYDLGSGSGW